MSLIFIAISGMKDAKIGNDTFCESNICGRVSFIIKLRFFIRKRLRLMDAIENVKRKEG